MLSTKIGRLLGRFVSSPIAASRLSSGGAAAESLQSDDAHVDSAEFDLPEYKLHKLSDEPARRAELTRAEALRMFESMYMMRRIETCANNMYKAKHIRGFLHLYNGQEACAVGIEAGIETTDAIIAAYRCHGFALTRGISPEAILGELTGRRNGCQSGIGGSMHMYTPNFYGGNGIVGAQVAVGTGIGLALKAQRRPNVCIALYGDGAANQGQVFESFNMAKLWSLPMIYVVENNGFGMGEEDGKKVQYSSTVV